MAATDLSRFNNDWYDPGRPAIVRALWFLANAGLMKSSLPGSRWRSSLLRLFGAKMGKGVVIKPCVNIKYPWNLTVGAHTWIGENVWIDNLGEVVIGSNCCLSQGAFLLCGNHDYKKETFDLMVQPVTLANGVWIGAKSVVCPGVQCGEHSVLSAGSVATKNMEPMKIYAGNPAVFVRERVLGS